MKKNTLRRYLFMILGIIIMGLGISIFKFSLMGNDPCNASYMAFADFVGIPYAIMAWILNAVWFIIEIIWARKLIGLGTFVNWFGVGVVATGFSWIINKLFTVPESFLGKLPILIIGILILSFSVSLYQTSNAGIAPFDALALILTERTHIPYFWCRIFTDGVCALAAWLLGGIIGLGTLVCAFGLGPFVSLYDKFISRPLIYGKGEKNS